MIKNKEIIISKNAQIIEALEKLNKTEKKNLICIDSDGKLVGIIADGDIRRALIRGLTIKDSLDNALNKNPVFVKDNIRKEEAIRLLSKETPVVPVVNKNQKVIGYYLYKEKTDYLPIKNRNITILGMGYVGLTLALIMADSGFYVKGYDINSELIDKLKQKEPSFYEEGIENLLKCRGSGRLNFYDEISECKSSIYIITVGTPLIKNSKTPNIKYLQRALKNIGKILEAGDLVVLRSTVPIGCSREVAIETLEKVSKLSCGSDFYLSFAPERTAEGKALSELKQNPQIIGAYDPISYEMTARLFHEITCSVIDVGSLEAAEMAKLIDNTFRDHLFAYSNFVAELAEKIKLDLHKIISAVNYGYERNMIPMPSPGVAGPCLSKDPYIMKKAFDKYEIDSSLIESTRKINEKGPSLIIQKCKRLLKKAGKTLNTVSKISLIGMAFKGEPETSDLRDSTSVYFLEKLKSKEKVCCFDPVVKKIDIEKLGIKPVTIEDAFADADLVVILNNHRSYKKLPIQKLLSTMNKPAVFIDTWYTFEPIRIKEENGIFYGGIGND